MKKLLIIMLILGIGLWFAGTKVEKWQKDEAVQYDERVSQWEKNVEDLKFLPDKIAAIDALMDKGKYNEAEVKLGELEKTVTAGALPFLEHRKAEIQYQLCESHIKSLIFFIRNKFEVETAQEMDAANKNCAEAESILQKIVSDKSAPDTAKFFAYYGLGNTSVRKALLAVSQEAQIEALKQAIQAYRSALEVKDDYNTKVNLELLFDLQKNAKEAAKDKGDKKPLKPEDFDLKPNNGASPGSGTKSKL